MTRTLRTNAETFWWVRPNSSFTAFNEDADDRPASVNSSLSSSLDTREIDAFRQGVEITTWKHWAQGTVKIHAGEVGHQAAPENYGLRDLSLRGLPLTDRDRADPVLFISASSGIAHQTSYLIPAWPPIQLDRTRATAFLLDGVLDPTDVRDINLCYGGDVPHDGRGVAGSVGSGNTDADGRTSQLTVFIEPVNSGSSIPFTDDPTAYGLRWPNVRRRAQVSVLSPFTDRRLYVGEEDAPSDPEIASVVNVASGSGDFIPPGCRASTMGWVYDDGVGTDSIAFGGLTY